CGACWGLSRRWNSGSGRTSRITGTRFLQSRKRYPEIDPSGSDRWARLVLPTGVRIFRSQEYNWCRIRGAKECLTRRKTPSADVCNRFGCISKGLTFSEVRPRRFEETIELGPVVRLRRSLPIIQDVADPAVDEGGVGVQGLDVPEQRGLIGEQARGREGEPGEGRPGGPTQAREIERALGDAPGEGQKAEMTQAQQESHQLVVMVQGDVNEGRAARAEQFFHLQDCHGVPAIAERDVAARQGPQVRAEDRVDARDSEARGPHR